MHALGLVYVLVLSDLIVACTAAAPEKLNNVEFRK